MITKTQGYADSRGVVHSTLLQAQVAEMRALLDEIDGSGCMPPDPEGGCQGLDRMAADLVGHSDELLAILTSGPRARPGRRKAAGTTQPKRAAKRASAAAVPPEPAVPATVPPEAARVGFATMREAVNAA